MPKSKHRKKHKAKVAHRKQVIKEIHNKTEAYKKKLMSSLIEASKKYEDAKKERENNNPQTENPAS